jgi:hypothetical protein
MQQPVSAAIWFRIPVVADPCKLICGFVLFSVEMIATGLLLERLLLIVTVYSTDECPVGYCR